MAGRIKPLPADAAMVGIVVAAGELDDVEAVRMAISHRLKMVERGTIIVSPEHHAAMLAERERYVEWEKWSEKVLERAVKAHPLRPAIEGMTGVGFKQVGRLLAAAGEPGERPNPAKYLQYCGHGDPDRSKRRKGEQLSYNPTAKMRAHLIANSAMRQMHSPYRAVYDAARAAWADHDKTELHKDNHARRLTAKAILRDLWRASHELSGAIIRTESTSTSPRDLAA